MRISTLIALLQKALAEHGDLMVGMRNPQFSGAFDAAANGVVRQAKRSTRWQDSDDEDLGEKFFGIF